MKMFRKFSRETGFTLVELMIVVLLTGLISIGLFSAYQAQQTSYVIQEQVAEMQQRVRAGLDLMITDLREAGYDPEITGVPAITTAQANAITFTLVADDDGLDNNLLGGADEPNELKTVRFALGDADGDGNNDDLLRDDSSSFGGVFDGFLPLIEDIDALEFFYTLDGGGQTTTPTAAQLADIRSVTITILVRSSGFDPKLVQNRTYALPSGAFTPAYTDQFRRRLLITTVQFRNRGLI